MLPRNAQTVRRLSVLKRILTSGHSSTNSQWSRFCSTTGATIRIDDVEKQIDPPKQPELVPNGYGECCFVVSYLIDIVLMTLVV